MMETYKVRLIVDGGRNGKDSGEDEGNGKDGDDNDKKMGGAKTKGKKTMRMKMMGAIPL